jgi:hypothetical protein
MFQMLVLTTVIASPLADDPVAKDVKTLIDTIETLQRPVEDFQCEFEGSTRFAGKVAEDSKGGIDKDGVYDSYSGIFIWKMGGDIHSNSLHRMAADNTIVRQTSVIRMREHKAEQHQRPNDASIQFIYTTTPKRVRSTARDPGQIFLIDTLKMQVADSVLESWVEDDNIEGHPFKVLNIALKGLPESLLCRYWIDLKRNGHVMRVESYTTGKVRCGQLDIKLAAFMIDDAKVWMPVSGESVGYAALVNGKPVATKEPTSFVKISVVAGTMEFNKKPKPDVFKITYQHGLPISDSFRKLTAEFGQNK